MIAKVPDKRSDGNSSFKSLLKYIGEREHIDRDSGEVSTYECSSTTNCLFKDTAWREMKAVADMNGRVKDPVYHFVISWPTDENPSDMQAFFAGLHCMTALGMEDHQYVFSVHRDTADVHVHCMVNRVNPETYRSVYPDRDYFKLDKAMREIEIQQGWRHDNGPYSVQIRDGIQVIDWTNETPSNRQENDIKMPGKARQMEVSTGNESLASYVQGSAKKDVLSVLRNKPHWQALHMALARHGLEIKPKGQGFAVFSRNDPMMTPVKASTMAQELGAGKLVKLLGKYQKPVNAVNSAESIREYSDLRPKRDQHTSDVKRNDRALERTRLRDQYKQFCNEWKLSRAPAKAALYEYQKLQQRTLTEQYKMKRKDILSSGLSVSDKRARYSVAAFEITLKRLALADAIKAERVLFNSRRVQGFRDWASDRAEEGVLAAIKQIRGFRYADKRRGQMGSQIDFPAGLEPHLRVADSEEFDPAQPQRLSERVSWIVDRNTGDVEYRMLEMTVFKDIGRHVIFTKSGAENGDAIEAGLLLAREKFSGQALEVRGDDAFKERVLQATIERKIKIRFSDPDMERRRQESLVKPDLSRFRKIAGVQQRYTPSINSLPAGHAEQSEPPQESAGPLANDEYEP